MDLTLTHRWQRPCRYHTPIILMCERLMQFTSISALTLKISPATANCCFIAPAISTLTFTFSQWKSSWLSRRTHKEIVTKSQWRYPHCCVRMTRFQIADSAYRKLKIPLSLASKYTHFHSSQRRLHLSDNKLKQFSYLEQSSKLFLSLHTFYFLVVGGTCNFLCYTRRNGEVGESKFH